MVHYRGGRAAIDADVYPDLEQFWDDLSAAYAARGPRARRAGLHLPPARRHQPGLPQRPGAAGAESPRRAATPSTSTSATSGRSTPRIADRPAGMDGHHPHVPGQLPLVVGGRGRLRLRGRGAVQRARRSTGSSSSTTTPAPAASSRCASCRRASGSCSAWSRRSGARWRTRTTLKRRIDEAASTCRSSSSACRRQCGFSSTVEGNGSPATSEVAKLRLIVETAEEVWG